MYVKTLKEIAAHESVTEVVRKRGKITVVLNTAAGWRHFDGGDVVEGADTAEVVAQFNAEKVCRASDFDRAPKEIVHESRRLWTDPVKGKTYHVIKYRMKLVGVSSVGPRYKPVEVLSETGRPPWNKGDPMETEMGCAWASIGGDPEKYGLSPKDVDGITERFETSPAAQFVAALKRATAPTMPPRFTVGDLIAALQTCPPTAEVLMSSDAEGNDFHSFHQASVEKKGATVILWPLHDNRNPDE